MGIREMSNIIEMTSENKERHFEISGDKSENEKPENLILIVDDCRIANDSVAKMVSRLGYPTAVAFDGSEGFCKAKALDPALVLMDVAMPVMDGFTACKAIKKWAGNRHIPVVFISGFTDPEERLGALEAGGDDYIDKPIRPEDLQFRIQTQFRIIELTRNLRNMNQNLENLVERKSRALVQTERRLHQAEKASTIRTLLAGIAEELRNPVIVIGGRAQMMREKGGLDDWHIKSLSHIETEIANAVGIIDNLKKVVQPRVDSPSLVDINEMISGMTRNFRYLTTWKVIDFHTKLEAEGRIKANASDIEQVVYNIVTNAVDAIPEKGQVCIRTCDETACRCIAVEDNGLGMSEETRRKIFDPFFTTKEAGKGAGLGMSIVFRIIRSHHATIIVESEENRGTKVIIKFPKI
ncbi:MAG: response regulator [Chitinivibrionales bacterium]|nr:response regulator [Chitinivibrionales bacterium]